MRRRRDCDGVAIACPTDRLAAAGAACRPVTSACDVAESCTGTDATCPAEMAAPNGSSCGDVNVCNGHETCAAGACAPGDPLDCDDGDPCTADACDMTSGCTNEPLASCDDGGTRRDAGRFEDGSTGDGGRDAGPVPSAEDDGCGCNTSPIGASGLLVLIAIGLVCRRRRER